MDCHEIFPHGLVSGLELYYASTTPTLSPIPTVKYRHFSLFTTGAVLAWFSPIPEIKCRLTIDFRVMPVLNQYRFHCWHGTDIQYRTSTDGQLPAKLPFRAAPVVGRTYASTMPALCQYRSSTVNSSAILVRYQVGIKFPPLDKTTCFISYQDKFIRFFN